MTHYNNDIYVLGHVICDCSSGKACKPAEERHEKKDMAAKQIFDTGTYRILATSLFLFVKRWQQCCNCYVQRCYVMFKD